MGKCIIVEGKLFMDKVYGPEAEKSFERDYDDWGHKDRVKEVFVVVEENDYNFYKNEGIMSTECIYVTHNKQDAIDELNDRD